MNALWHDLRYALRSLRNSPGYVAAVLVTLALAIGVNTAIFSIVNVLMLRPLPFPEPQRLGALMVHYNSSHGSEDDMTADGQTWQMVRDDVPAAQAAVFGETSGVNLQTGSSVAYVYDARVSAPYFDVLGVRPMMGRMFTENEDRAGGPPVAVLSYGLWKKTFGGDPAILGRSIQLKGEPYTVVGVMPQQLSVNPDLWEIGFSTGSADLWTPLRPSTTGEGEGNNYAIYLRLRPGHTWAEVDSELKPLQPRFLRSMSGVSGWLFAESLQQALTQPDRDQILGLMIVVGIILLIACANLAGLTMVRLGRRSAEMATRMALGATRGMLARRLWLESVLVALAGGGAGILVGRLCLAGIAKLIPPGFLPVQNFPLDPYVLLFTFGIAVAASLLFGMLPAVGLRRVDLASTMNAASGRAIHGGRSRMRSLLIAAEIALTLMLVASAGLLVRTLISLESLPPGFNAANVFTATASINEKRYQDAGAFHALLQESIAAMRRIPGVENAAVGLSLPYQRGLNLGVNLIDGPDAGHGTGSSVAYVTPGYFDVLRMNLLSGRLFSDSDGSGSLPVAIVNRSFARKYLGQDAIGRHIAFSGRHPLPLTVVGIVDDVVKVPGLNRTAPLATEPMLYVPAAQVAQWVVNTADTWFQPSWLVRTSGHVAGLGLEMQSALAEADPNLPFSGFAAVSDFEAHALSEQRVELALLAALGSLALLLSLVGVYGLVSSMVVQRQREIGLRLALGSNLSQVMLSVARRGLAAVWPGLGAGLILCAFVLGALRSVLYGVQPYDPLTLTATTILLAAVAAIASLLPALRIVRIDPAKTLREE